MKKAERVKPALGEKFKKSFTLRPSKTRHTCLHKLTQKGCEKRDNSGCLGHYFTT